MLYLARGESVAVAKQEAPVVAGMVVEEFGR
jgi:hypothetical protein